MKLLKKLTKLFCKLFWLRIPFGGILGIRISKWFFLTVMSFSCGYVGDIRYEIPTNNGNWRLGSIGFRLFPCRP